MAAQEAPLPEVGGEHETENLGLEAPKPEVGSQLLIK